MYVAAYIYCVGSQQQALNVAANLQLRQVVKALVHVFRRLQLQIALHTFIFSQKPHSGAYGCVLRIKHAATAFAKSSCIYGTHCISLPCNNVDLSKLLLRGTCGSPIADLFPLWRRKVGHGYFDEKIMHKIIGEIISDCCNGMRLRRRIIL